MRGKAIFNTSDPLVHNQETDDLFWEANRESCLGNHSLSLAPIAHLSLHERAHGTHFFDSNGKAEALRQPWDANRVTGRVVVSAERSGTAHSAIRRYW